MDYDEVISDLKQDAEARKDAVSALSAMRDELGRVIDRLSGSSRKKKPRTTGRGVTTDDVRQVVNDIRAEMPDLSDELVRSRVKERLKGSGKRLTGISLRLAQVLGESSTDGRP